MERYLRVNLLGPGPRLMEKEFTGRGLTKVEKHCTMGPILFKDVLTLKFIHKL